MGIMTNVDLLAAILTAYMDRYRQSSVSYSQIVPFMERYALEHPEQEAELVALTRGNLRALGNLLDAAEQDGIIQVMRKDTNPLTIVYPAYFHQLINRYYQRIDDHPQSPFPLDSQLGLDVPGDMIQSVDIKSDFLSWLSRDERQGEQILKVNFPDGIHSMLCTVSSLKKNVLSGAVHKLRHYLQDTKNLAYTRQKLVPMLKGRELAVRELLQTIVASPESACATVREPTDFTFHLWTQLSSNIIKEYAQKIDKLSEEQGFCQAAYLVGYYNVYNRGILQRKKEEELAASVLIQCLKRAPFAYPMSDIHQFKDDKGILLATRLDRDKMTQIIKARLTPAPNKDTPEILRINAGEGEPSYVHFTSVPQLVSEQLLKAQRDSREFYKHSWTLALKQNIEFTTMHQDGEFLKHLAARLANHFPLLASLMDPKIINIAARQDACTEPFRSDLLGLMESGGAVLRPLNQILRVERKKIYDDARILLPAWMVIPGIRTVVRLVRILFLGPDLANKPYAEFFDHEGQERVQEKEGKKKGKETRETGKIASGEADGGGKEERNRQQIQKYRDAAKSLEPEFLPPGGSLEVSLSMLLDRWNTILDSQTKANLTTDVNSLCRDYLKKMRITSKAKLPSSADVRAYAIKVWETETLQKIRNRKDLLRYLELYILSLLENMN